MTLFLRNGGILNCKPDAVNTPPGVYKLTTLERYPSGLWAKVLGRELRAEFANQFGQRTHIQFRHDACSVQFDGGGCATVEIGNLLVGVPKHHPFANLKLTRGKFLKLHGHVLIFVFCSRASWLNCMARATTSSMLCVLNGLSKKSKAPCFMAVMISSGLLSPLIKMMGKFWPASFMCACKSIPIMQGMRISSNITAWAGAGAAAKNAWASACTDTA